MEIARMHDLGIEGACEGSIACATCHVIVDAAYAHRLDEASAEEEDMLDLALGVQPTSRLGCQIVLTDELDGLTVRLPASA
jgi:2Fe-2S ferredoxin